MQEKKFLAIASRKNHNSILDPVIKNFKKRKYEIRYLNISFIYEKINRKYSKVGTSFEHQNKMHKRSIDIVSLLKQTILKISVHISSILLRAYKPSVILIVSENTILEKVMILAADKLHIPTIRIQEGVYGKSYVPGVIKVSVLAVMGPFYKAHLLNNDVPSEIIYITGNPRYDQMLQYKMKETEVSKKQKLSLPLDKKLILLATQPVSENQRRSVLNSVCNTISSNSEMILLIKPHPSESSKLHKEVVEDTQIKNYILCDNMNSFELTSVCDVLITIHSTIALEAMFFEKPIITVNYSGKADVMSYAEEGAAIGVYSVNELPLALNKTLYDKHLISDLRDKQQIYLHEHLSNMDGKSSERIVSIAETLIYEKR